MDGVNIGLSISGQPRLHPTFVHLTDLHIGAPELFDDHLLSDTSSTLATILDDIKSIVPQPDFIVVSADLVSRGESIDL
ncbi:hypothetical protein IFT84_11260 [Rhizobium sp. CFBP 8762]|uniref:hypothetical protein n=1 Tax=Rhizobium sp. CFBP 8762 TaxID=2775279 RepID=UPI00177DB581|nr:hypothetical protein [Rhizobium sp. CFBP 8762]MBD8555103.1 hypothetical protein [Rhizobium sp. CFBP 8762]